jgi:hypothetical protein
VFFNVTATQDYTFSDNLTLSGAASLSDTFANTFLIDETTNTYLGLDENLNGTKLSSGVTNGNIRLFAGDTYRFTASSVAINDISGSGSGTVTATWSASLTPANASAAPEPTSLAVWGGLGIAGLLVARRQKRSQLTAA